MKLYQKILSFFLCITSLILILSFKSIPSGKLWKKYTVLFTPISTPDYLITNILDSNGIEGYICLSNQYLPVNLNENSPEVSLLKANSTSPEYSYYVKRNFYFFDKSQNFRLYYIPSNQKHKLIDCLKVFNSSKINVGVDSNSSYPFFLPLLFLILSIVFTLFSKNKILFASSAVIPVIFVFCNPFFSITVAGSLILILLFFVSNLWNRAGFFRQIFKNYFSIIFLSLAVLSAFFSSLKSGFLFLFCLIGLVSELICYYSVEEFINSKKVFTPVFIRSARRVSAYNKNKKQILTSSICYCVLCLILLLITSFTTITAKTSKIILPGEKGASTSVLPSMQDYYNFMWTVKSKPYQSLNKNSATDSYSFPRYVYEDGIVKQYTVEESFDEVFMEEVYDQIDILPFNSIEKVMKSQNKNFAGHYTALNSYSTNVFSIILMFISLFVLLFIYISTIIVKGSKK